MMIDTERPLTTRFAPTCGPVHMGHMSTLFANLLVAKKTGGSFFILIDPAQNPHGLTDYPVMCDEAVLSYRVASFYRDWCHYWCPVIVRSKFNAGILATVMQRLGKPVFHTLLDRENTTMLSVMDYLMGTNCILRGREFSSEKQATMERQACVHLAGSHLLLLSAFSEETIEYDILPSLVFKDVKISKSDETWKVFSVPKASYGIPHSVDSRFYGFSFLEAFMFIVSCWESEVVNDVERLLHYHEEFDINAFCGRDNIEVTRSIGSLANDVHAASEGKSASFAKKIFSTLCPSVSGCGFMDFSGGASDAGNCR